jgi:putative DNA primase/helicase
MPRPVLGPKPVSPIVPIAKKLKENGFDPIPLRSKTEPYVGWRTDPNTPADIKKWRGGAIALRMYGHPDLFAIDLDIQRQDVMDEVIRRYTERWPEFMARCIIRHSGAVKAMLIGRMATDKKYMYSGRYGVTEEHKGGNRVELFTHNDPRYILVYGLHSEGRFYGYDGPCLYDVRYENLPWFSDTDLNELLEVAEEIMKALGLPLSEPGGSGSDAGIIYDLEPDMVAELDDGRTVTLEELEEEAVDHFIYLHGRLFDAGSGHFRIKAKVTSRGLTLWDFGDNGAVHCWKHLGSQPEILAPLLKKLEADRIAATAETEEAIAAAIAPPPPPPPGGNPNLFEELLAGRLTQDGIALVFAEHFSETMQYCHNTKSWYHWTGVYWKPEETDLALQYCRELGRTFSGASRASELKEVRKYGFARGVEKLVQGDRRVATTAKRWNQDLYLLGTPEGTLDLRTGVLRAANPADGITRLAAVAPCAGPKPLFERFLRETFQNDAELILFAQVWFGYCLTGDISEHALWFGFGEGGNGKGVLINTITGIMKDYAVTAAMDTFVAARGDRHSTEIAMLQGARLVTASETERGRAWAEARIKQITGGDPITARFMRQDNFTFTPQFKLALMGNHKPLLRGVDDAVRRRFNLVPFLNKPPVVDKQLEKKIREEWPAILQWLVEGCLMWQASGLMRPTKVIAATDSYFADQDIVQQWLDDCCEVRHGTPFSEPTAVLFTSWNDYAGKAGEYVGNRKAFVTELARRGFEPFRAGHGNIRSLRGIKLKASPLAKAVLSIVPNDLDQEKKTEE